MYVHEKNNPITSANLAASHPLRQHQDPNTPSLTLYKPEGRLSNKKNIQKTKNNKEIKKETINKQAQQKNTKHEQAVTPVVAPQAKECHQKARTPIRNR